MMRRCPPRSQITHKHTDIRMDVVTLLSLGKKMVVVEVKHTRQCSVDPVKVPHKLEIDMVLKALSDLPNETINFPSMATERAAESSTSLRD